MLGGGVYGHAQVHRTWGYNYANGPTSFDFTPKDATQRARNLRLGSLEKREEFMELCSFRTTMIKRRIFIESTLGRIQQWEFGVWSLSLSD
jgi:hypothetical protein